MKDRFDLEQEIMNISCLRFPLDTLAQRLLDGDIGIHEASVIISGVGGMLDLYSDSLHDTMSQALGLDEYRQEEEQAPDEYSKDPFPNSKLDPRYPYNYNL